MIYSLHSHRAFAELAACAFHMSMAFQEPRFGGEASLKEWNTGYREADCFVALSGFTTFKAHIHDIGQPATLPKYLWQRATGIYPVYWLVLAAVVIGSLIASDANKSPPRTVDWISIATLVRLTDAKSPVDPARTLVHDIIFCGVLSLLIRRVSIGITSKA